MVKDTRYHLAASYRAAFVTLLHFSLLCGGSLSAIETEFEEAYNSATLDCLLANFGERPPTAKELRSLLEISAKRGLLYPEGVPLEIRVVAPDFFFGTAETTHVHPGGQFRTIRNYTNGPHSNYLEEIRREILHGTDVQQSKSGPEIGRLSRRLNQLSEQAERLLWFVVARREDPPNRYQIRNVLGAFLLVLNHRVQELPFAHFVGMVSKDAPILTELMASFPPSLNRQYGELRNYYRNKNNTAPQVSWQFVRALAEAYGAITIDEHASKFANVFAHAISPRLSKSYSDRYGLGSPRPFSYQNPKNRDQTKRSLILTADPTAVADAMAASAWEQIGPLIMPSH